MITPEHDEEHVEVDGQLALFDEDGDPTPEALPDAAPKPPEEN